MTKIDIISGFLGAGKTTLIKKLIDEAFTGEKLVLIENEYGEVGIDSGFLKDTGIEITEMNSGCICCTLVGDFTRSLRDVMDRFHPDRIVIEPTGVGKLSDVMASVIRMEESDGDLQLGSLVTVVNTLKAKKQLKGFGEFFSNQIEHATTIVLSRTQSANEQQIDECLHLIRELNADAAVITTPWDDIAGSKILEAMEGRDSVEMRALAMAHHEHDAKEHEEHHEHEHHHHHEEHHHHHEDKDDVQPLESADADEAAQSMQSTPASGAPLHAKHHHHDEHEHHHHHHEHHHADDIFDTWGKETPHIFQKDTIENAMKHLAESEDCGTILRAKGMVPSEDGTWIYFDLVDGEYELRGGEPDFTGRLVVIGTDLNESAIETLFGLTD